MYTGLALNLLTSFSIAVEYMEHDKEYNAIPKKTLDVKAMKVHSLELNTFYFKKTELGQNMHEF